MYSLLAYYPQLQSKPFPWRQVHTSHFPHGGPESVHSSSTPYSIPILTRLVLILWKLDTMDALGLGEESWSESLGHFKTGSECPILPCSLLVYALIGISMTQDIHFLCVAINIQTSQLLLQTINILWLSCRMRHWTTSSFQEPSILSESILYPRVLNLSTSY